MEGSKQTDSPLLDKVPEHVIEQVRQHAREHGREQAREHTRARIHHRLYGVPLPDGVEPGGPYED